MRVTFVGARRPAVRAAGTAAGVCAEADAGLDTPPSAAPTTPPSDFAKILRSTAISPHAIVTVARTRTFPPSFPLGCTAQLIGALYARTFDRRRSRHNGAIRRVR